MQRRFTTRFFLIIFSLIHFNFPCISSAVEWKFEPELNVGTEFNDNFLLSSLSKKSVLGMLTSPRLRLGVVEERLDARAVLSLSDNRYIGNSEFDTTDFFVHFNPVYKLENGRWQLNVSFRKDTTLRDELTVTGLVLQRAKRSLSTLHAIRSISISEYRSLDFEYRISQADYSEGERLGLFDYSDQLVAMRYANRPTEKDWHRFELSYANNQVSLRDLRRNTLSARIGLDRQYSEFLEVILMIGGYYLEQSGTGVGKDGFLLSAKIKKQFDERTQIDAGVERRIFPSGSGSLLQSDHLSISVGRQFKHNLGGLFSTNFYENRRLEQTKGSNKSRFYRVVSALRWYWAEEWIFSASYRYSGGEREDGSKLRSNAVSLLLTYKWPKKFE